MEETPPPFSLPGRDRERWGGPAANILPVAMPLLLASSSHPVCQGWVVFFFLNLIVSHYHCHLHSELEREGKRHRNGRTDKKKRKSERNCACLCVCAVESMPA